MEKPRISRASTGFKSFRPPAALTFVLLSLFAVFLALGSWQVMRAMEKSATELQHQQATGMPLKNAISGNNRFAQIEVRGQYDTNRHIMLDNQIWRGRGGVHVFTPFFAGDGTVILVNRGWLPLSADRRVMPEIPTPQHEIVVKGMLNTLPVPGRILGSADQLDQDRWPQMVTYLNLEDISAALQLPLENWVIQLSETQQHGFEGRQWKPVFLSASRHKGYAFQWFALATACVAMWIFLGFRKPTGNRQ